MVKEYQDYSGTVSVAASLTAQNTFTEEIVPRKGSPMNVSVSGTWAGTIVLQRSFNAGSTWVDVASYTANTEGVIESVEDKVRWRVGFKTGAYTSGTAVCRLSQ